MNRTDQIKQLLEKYGLQGYVINDSEYIAVKCFVQPMRYKNKMYLDSQYTKLGIIDETCFLYIGPPESALCEGTEITLELTDGRLFTCSKTETVYCCNEPAYTWAILRQRRYV